MKNKEKMQYIFVVLAVILYTLAVQTAGYPEIRYDYAPESSSEGRGKVISPDCILPYSDESLMQQREPYGFYNWELYNSSWAAEMQLRKNKIREEARDAL